MKRFLALVFFFSKLCASVSNVATGGDPSALIAGHVNVLTGQLIDQRHDLLLPGPNPIYLDSFFSSYVEGHDFGGHWQMLPHLKLKKKVREEFIVWSTPSGSTLSFGKRNDGDGTGLKPNLPKDMTNTFSGYPNGKDDIRNIRIQKLIHDEGKVKLKPGRHDVYRVELGDGRKLFYREYKTKDGWIYYRLEWESKLNGWWLHYSYDRGSGKCTIENKNPNQEGDYGKVWLCYTRGNSSLIINAKLGGKPQDAQEDFHHQVEFSRPEHSNPFPTKFCSAFTGIQDYYVNQRNKKRRLLNTIDSQNGHCVDFGYVYEHFPEKKKRDKVDRILLPKNNGETERVLNFSYVLDAYPKECHTAIEYPDGGLAKHYFNRNFIPTKIEKYNKDRCASQEKFFWHFEPDTELRYSSYFHTLRGKVICDGEKPVLDTSYNYGEANNVKEEVMKGRFTGKELTIKTDDQGRIISGAEKKVTHFDYTHLNRLSYKQHPNGDYEKIEYWGSTHLPTSHKLYDHNDKLISSITWTYNDLNLPIEIDDNGIVSKMTYDDQGFLRKEVSPNGTTEFSYEKGFLKSKKHNGVQTLYSYDSYWRCNKEENPHATVERKYDMRGLLIEETINGVKTTNKYDLANRLEKKSVESRGELRVTTYEYDLKSRKTKEIDYRGIVTEYAYDHLDNLLSEKVAGRIVKRYEYDNLGNCIRAYDGENNCTQTTYGSLGQPFVQTDPNKNTISKVYDLKGRVIKEIHSDGREIHSEYDPLDRPVKITTHGGGKTLHTVENEYRGKFLVKQSVNGLSTTFAYDERGRQVEKRCKEKKTTYAYDDFNRVICENKNGIETHKSYDFHGQVLSESIICDEQVYSHMEFSYDEQQNCIEKRVYTATKTLVDRYRFDGFSQVIAHTTPEGLTTEYRYGKDSKTTSHPNGVKTIERFDAWGNLIELKKCHETTTLLREEFEYDKAKRKILQRSFIYGQEGDPIVHLTKWTYDGVGNCLTQTEGERVTTMTYKDNRLQTLTKNDGKTLIYTYDELGNNTSIESSDDTLFVSTKYDVFGRATKASDGTVRKYDDFGNMTYEKLANGLTIEREFDLHDRLTKLTLHDESIVEYEYEGIHLRRVKRNGLTHTYTEYDSPGICTQQVPMLSNSPIILNLDFAGRPEQLMQWGTSHTVERNRDGHVSRSIWDFDPHTATSNYTYDQLDQLSSESYPIQEKYAHNSHGSTSKRHEIEGAKYDENGNCTQLRGTKFTYDVLDRLITIEPQEGEATTFTYDSFNRVMQVNDRDKIYYDDQHEIGTYAAGKPTLLRVLGLKPMAEIGAALLIEINGTPYQPLHDLFGNVMALSQEGVPIEYNIYSAFGTAITFNDENYTTTSKIPYAYQSKRAYNGFISFGRRFYDPATHTFLNPDPKGLDLTPNRYHYLNNNPLMHHDPWGLEELLGLNDYNHAWNLLASGRGNQMTYEPQYFARQTALRHNQTRSEMSPYQRSHAIPSRYRHDERLHGGAQRLDLGLPELDVGYNILVAGLGTDYTTMMANLRFKSQLLHNRNVHGVFTETHGFWQDVRRAKRTMQDGDVGEAGLLVIEEIIRGLMYLPANAFLKIDVHSEGALTMRSVLEMLPQSIRDRIIVAQYNPAAYIAQNMAGKVLGFSSQRDIVPWLDLSGKIKAKGYFKTIPPHPDANGVDHGFMSPTLLPDMKRTDDKYYWTGT